MQIPIGVAANVCGVQANVLAQGGIQEPVDCTASTTQDLPVAFRGVPPVPWTLLIVERRA